MTNRKNKRNDIVTLTETSGFSVTIKLTGYCAVDHFPLCKTIADIQRCATMGDFEVLGYDLIAA